MIYVGLPVHDERHTIGPLLWRIRKLLAELGREFRLLAVDDGSTDGTAEILGAYGQVLPLTVLRHDDRRGYAAALERLVREAVRRSDYRRRDALVTLQADFTDPPEAMPEMVRRFEGGMDLVTCAPLGSGDGLGDEGEADGEGDEESAPSGREPLPPPRPVRWARRVSPWVTRGLAAPEGVSDPLGSLRLYRLFTLERALGDLPDPGAPLLTQRGWAANLELLLATWPHARRAAEVAASPDYGRRYRTSRFRPFSELWSLGRAGRHPRLRELERRAAESE